MDIKKYVESISPPWTSLQREPLENYLKEASTEEIPKIIDQLILIMIVHGRINLGTEGHLPDDLMQYSSFLDADITQRINSLSGVFDGKVKIGDVLEINGIKQPTKNQIEWTTNWWIKSILEDQVEIVLSFLNRYLCHDSERVISGLLFSVLKNKLDQLGQKSIIDVVSLLATTRPKEAIEFFPAIIEKLSDPNTIRFTEDYLKLAKQEASKQ